MANGGVSVTAWQKSLDEINARFEKLEKNNNGTVSINAWNNALESIEKRLKDLSDKVDSKVGIKAWENSLKDLDSQFKTLALSDLKIFDERLDRTVMLITDLTNNLNNKVNVNAWDRLCSNNEELTTSVNSLRNNHEEIIKRLSEVESLIRNAQVSEQELKKLLESI